MLRTSSVVVQGGTLAAYEFGEGPPVLFLHGGPGDTHHYMARMAEPLAKKFRCIFFDQRGTGGSNTFDRRENEFGVEVLLEDLDAILRHLKVSRPALVGHSWGAMYALFATIRNSANWSRAALLSMGPLDVPTGLLTAERLEQSFAAPERGKWLAFRKARNLARDRHDTFEVERIDREMMKLRANVWIFDPNLRETFLTEYFQDPPCDREVNKWIWTAAESWFSWEKARMASLPIWICSGAEDHVPISQSERLASQVPQASLSVIKNCGHMPWLDAPKFFYSHLEAFLNAEQA